MFHKETVLILGAGTSVDYGFPTGSQLIEKIVAANPNNALGRRLREFTPVSIDRFLKDHIDLRDIGKQAIVRVLLKCEDQSCFSNSYSPAKHDSPKYGWYRDLLDGITSGCQKPEDIFHNKLKIITFNYDVSLEVYLSLRLPKIPFFGKIGQKFLEDFFANRVIHVYGALYNSQNYPFYGSTDRQLFDHYSKNIWTIGEEKAGEECVKKACETAYNWIIKAERLVALGYGFDPVNNNLLFGTDPGILFRKTSTRVTDFKCPQLLQFCYSNYSDSSKIDLRVNSFFPPEQERIGDFKIHTSKPQKSISQILAEDFPLT